MRNRFVLATVALSTCLTICQSVLAVPAVLVKPEFPARITHSVSYEKERMFDNYKLDFQNDEVYRFDGPIYSIISHVDDGWDVDRVSFEGSRRLIQYSRKNGITSFGFISSYGGGAQVFGQKDVNFIVNSEAGSHKFQFPNGRTFLVAGGNMSLCLCEVLRDIILGTQVSNVKGGIDIVLVTDGVYDATSYWPSQLNGKPAPGGSKFVLEDMNSSKDDRFIAEYLEQRVLGRDGVFCPGQNYYNHDNVDANDYTFELYRGKRKVKTVGSKGRVIRVVLSTTAQLDATIKLLEAKRPPQGIAL